MKTVIRLTIIGILLLTSGLTIQAQEPGSGGIIVVPSPYPTSQIENLNPVRLGGWNEINSLMFPSMVGVSPFAQYYAGVGETGVTNALATDWTISADGLTYTFTLRRDAIWSDGMPVTATDVKFSFDALASVGNSPVPYVYDPESSPYGVSEIAVVGEYTVQAVFKDVNCNGLGPTRFPVIPAHVFGYDNSPDFDFSVMVGHPFDTNPSVVYGPFRLDYIRFGEEIAFKPVPTWADGPVIPDEIVFRDTNGPEDATARFLVGEFDVIIENLQMCPTCITKIRAAPNVKVVGLPKNSWDFIGLNLADPNNPQPGEDAQGNLIDQGHHPLFGDVQVRRALQHAINVPEIIQDAVNGQAIQMASSQMPTSWAADPDLAPVSYDPMLAAQMLDKAGWPLGPDGIRVCRGCKYAMDGTFFAFELITNQGNFRREATGELVKDQLHAVGIEVDFQTIGFDDLLYALSDQDFDACILGWGDFTPSDPDQLWIFGPGTDLVSLSGYNFGSYYNPEFVRLSEKAVSLPGCDPSARAKIYHQIDRLLQEDQPYLWLYALNDLYAAHDYVFGFDPQPNMPWWNIHTWQVIRP